MFEALVPPSTLPFAVIAESYAGLDDSQEGTLFEVLEVGLKGGGPVVSGGGGVPGAADAMGLVDEDVSAGDVILLNVSSPCSDGE
jgi:hypothetical protein